MSLIPHGLDGFSSFKLEKKWSHSFPHCQCLGDIFVFEMPLFPFMTHGSFEWGIRFLVTLHVSVISFCKFPLLKNVFDNIWVPIQFKKVEPLFLCLSATLHLYVMTYLDTLDDVAGVCLSGLF